MAEPVATHSFLHRGRRLVTHFCRRLSNCFALRNLYSITSSALSKIDCGTVRPRALTVLRLTTISNLLGNCTGRSPGFAPRRMRSTYKAARRQRSALSTPYKTKPPSLAPTSLLFQPKPACDRSTVSHHGAASQAEGDIGGAPCPTEGGEPRADRWLRGSCLAC
jgi:hypothetical protein